MKILSVFRLAKFAVSSDLNLDSGHLDSEQVGCRLQRKIFGARRSPLVQVSGLSCLFSPPILPLYADCGPFLEIPSKGNRGQLGIHNRELASTEDLDFVKISKVEDLDFLFPTCHKINTQVYLSSMNFASNATYLSGF